MNKKVDFKYICAWRRSKKRPFEAAEQPPSNARFPSPSPWSLLHVYRYLARAYVREREKRSSRISFGQCSTKGERDHHDLRLKIKGLTPKEWILAFFELSGETFPFPLKFCCEPKLSSKAVLGDFFRSIHGKERIKSWPQTGRKETSSSSAFPLERSRKGTFS